MPPAPADVRAASQEAAAAAQQTAVMVLRMSTPPSPRIPAHTGCTGRLQRTGTVVAALPASLAGLLVHSALFFFPTALAMPLERLQGQLQVGSQESAGAAPGSRLAEIG